MSGKSRYGGVISNAARYDPEAKDSPTVAATISTEAVQASWAQYVQRLVSEQIAEIRHGVIEGLREGINEQVGRLRRERDSNSAKVERALADIRAAKAEMREAIRTELRAEIRTEIADRMALIKQPVDGAPGPRGEKGAPGSLPMIEPYIAGRIYYRGNVVTDQTGSYQTRRDTATAPCSESEDWTCLARSGADGKDGCTIRSRGTYDPAKTYERLDTVMLNGSSFVAQRHDPGPCPGEHWQLFASAGKRGQQGQKGERGERGPPGPLAIAPRIARSEIDAGYNLNLLYTDGSRDTIPLRPAFERFFSELRT